MRFQISSLLFFGLFRFSTQFDDIGFSNYCNRANGEIGKQQSVNGQPSLGDTCKFTLDLPTENDDEAKEHCENWAIHLLKSSKMKNEMAECVVENRYQCRDSFEQIRGMCYKVMPEEWVTYEEATTICSRAQSEILKLSNIHFGEILEDQFHRLTGYFLQPDEQLESWVTFSGGKGPNYVVLFNSAHFYGTGANGIMRFKAEQRADVMCMYQPLPTASSFSENLAKLAPYYHPTVFGGVSTVWRTSGMYTRTSLPDHDVCEASMKAVIGTNQGTLMNLDPRYTNALSTDLRKSVVQVYAPFEDCWYPRRVDPSHAVFFRDKTTTVNQDCTRNAHIPEQDYNANFHRYEARNENPWSYSYYPTKAGGLNFDTRRFAIHGPMLCGMVSIADERRVPECPRDGVKWYRVQRSPGEYVCHAQFFIRMSFWQADSFCKNGGYQMSRWSSVNEFIHVRRIANSATCYWLGTSIIVQCKPWVWCMNTDGCTDYAKDQSFFGYWRHAQMTDDGSPSWYREGDSSNVMCEVKAT